MNMDSVFFLSCFLPVTLGLYWLLPGLRAKNWVLLAFSLLFYCFSGLEGLIVLLAVCTVNYLLGLVLRGKRFRRTAAVAGVALDLGLLVACKYLDLFFGALPGMDRLTQSLIVPLGVSFFIFKCIAYLVDAYREPSRATGSFLDLALYVSFFPQITMGPITRFSEFEPQLRARQVTSDGAAEGLRRFAVGLGKCLVIASTLGRLADGVFEAGVPVDARLAWLGAIAYCLQLYFDFSGCIDMAIGLGTVFGFTTRENFDHPYTAISIGDFWRRWHMSLSAWFRDYLYIPLGGNRKGRLRTGLNKCIVFVFCGLWHGANGTFLLWGLWHGLLSALESMDVIPVKKLSKSRAGRGVGRAYTLLAVCLGFVMFRAADVGQGFAMLRAMFTGFAFTDAGTVLLHRLLTGETVLMLVLGLLLSLPVGRWLWNREKLRRVLEPASWLLALGLLVLCVIKLAAGDFAPSIYGQF